MSLQTITVPEPQVGRLSVKLKGTSPLIMHEWSEKSKRQIREKQQKKACKKHSKRDPKAEYESAKVLTSDGKMAVKAISIKKAIVGAARLIDDLPMTLLRVSIFVRGDEDGLIPLKFKKEKMVEDVVRIGRGVADLRYRPYLYDWEVKVNIDYNSDVLSAEQVLNLVKLAGFGGLCENRPSKSGGDYGTFEVLPIK